MDARNVFVEYSKFLNIDHVIGFSINFIPKNTKSSNDAEFLQGYSQSQLNRSERQLNELSQMPSRQASLATAKKKGKIVCGPSRFHPQWSFLLTFAILKNYKVD